MKRELLLGNQAIARGAWEAGVTFAAGYPGTPSTEILETLVHYPEVHARWSANEKVAFEVALAASWSGLRSAVTMKQVGLNVASDPLFSAAYTGVKGGFVVIPADDPGPHSSQTEQDSRLLALSAKVPVFDPSTPAEARSRSASSHTIMGSLPPSSRVMRFSSGPATCMMWRPVAVSPVKATRRTRGWRTSSSPTTLPGPVTTFTAPAGTPASCISSMIRMAASGVVLAGL